MALQPFSWGAAGEKASPSRVKKYADIAEALASKGGSPKTFGEGLNRIGEALLHNSYEAKAAAGETEGAASRKAVLDALMANPDPSMTDITGALGNEWVASDPGSQALVQALMGQEQQQQGWARDDALRADDRAYDAPQRDVDLEKSRLELEAMRNPTPEFSMVPADEVAAMGLPEGAYQRGADGKLYEVGGGGTKVEVNTGDGAPGLGKLSTDFGYVLGADGKPVIDPVTHLPTAAAIPGSPAAIEAAKVAAAADAKGTTTGRYGNVVVEDIDRALTTLANDPTWTTGVLGQAMGNFKGSSADRLNNLLDTVKANSGFDRLQAMRDASPTGGALGAVSETENKLLQSAIGSLETSNADDLAYNLKRVQRIYDEIINGPKADAAAPGQSQANPDVVDFSDYFK